MRETFSIRPTRHYMPVEDVIIGDESKFLIVAFLYVKHLAFAPPFLPSWYITHFVCERSGLDAQSDHTYIKS